MGKKFSTSFYADSEVLEAARRSIDGKDTLSGFLNKAVVEKIERDRIALCMKPITDFAMTLGPGESKVITEWISRNHVDERKLMREWLLGIVRSPRRKQH